MLNSCWIWEVGSLHCDRDGNYRYFTFKCLTPYTSLRNTTSGCYYDGLCNSERRLGLETVHPEYENLSKASCRDGDAAVGRAERSRTSVDPPGMLSMETLCHVHRGATAREESCLSISKTTAHIRHLVLSLRVPGGRKVFRCAMRTAVLLCLRIVRNRQPSEAAGGSLIYYTILIKIN